MRNRRERYVVGEASNRSDNRRWVVVDADDSCVLEDNLTESEADDLADDFNSSGGRRVVRAQWDGRRYLVDPSSTTCDVSGDSGVDGWWSEDGDNWLDCGGGLPAGDFESVAIRFVDGPRCGEQVA